MKTVSRVLISAFATFAALAFAAEPGPAKTPGPGAPLTPRFKQVRERIEALYQHRNEPPPPPSGREDPFRRPGTAYVPLPIASPTADEPGLPVREAPSSDLTRLQASVATLRVSGTFEREGRLYLVINSKTYKENDVIQTQVQGEEVYLRVRQISRRGVTVALNEAEMTLKF